MDDYGFDLEVKEYDVEVNIEILAAEGWQVRILEKDNGMYLVEIVDIDGVDDEVIAAVEGGSIDITIAYALQDAMKQDDT